MSVDFWLYWLAAGAASIKAAAGSHQKFVPCQEQMLLRWSYSPPMYRDLFNCGPSEGGTK